MQLIFWAGGINGEGSSKVAIKLIKALLENSENINFKIFISSQSTLDNEIRENGLFNYSKICKLPKLYRSYPIQFLIKFFFPINFFCNALITLDDYPFRNASNQILYFHQPNIIFSEKIIWKFKKLVFNILMTNKIKIFVQTHHFKNALMNNFRNIKSRNIITELHFDT